MKIGEVCLMTGDVIRLANFYRQLFRIEGDCLDPVHQFIIEGETALAIYCDGVPRESNLQNIVLAFTVDDVEAEFSRVKALGAQIVTPPTLRPWGAKNMSFLDPDGNLITFRSFPGQN